MKILYIEDDFIDKKNMEWLCRNFPKVELCILNDFEEASNYLEKHKPDLIFTDRRIGNTDFSKFSHLWENIPYYVISNTIFKEKELLKEPIDYLQKPLVHSTLESIFNQNAPKFDEPNMDYFKDFPSPKLVSEMKELLIEELLNAQKKIPAILDDKDNQLSRTVHNLAGKFSLLGMEKTFNLCRTIESLLKDGKPINTLVQDLLSGIEVSLTYLNTQKK